MNSYMGPDEMDSPTCIRKGNCQPIGGQSVWASEAPVKSERPIVLVATQMDDASLFYEDASGRTAITASVLLAVAQAIRALPVSRSNQLLVAFFQGESWGRGGSRQWVGDITSFTCEQEVARADSPFNDRICTSPLRVWSCRGFDPSSLSASETFPSTASSRCSFLISCFPRRSSTSITRPMRRRSILRHLFFPRRPWVCLRVLRRPSTRRASATCT